MTYVSKKEKVFDLPDQDDESTISLVTGDAKLKRFPSVSDRRAWTTEENQRYQHLYGLVNGSESNISKSSGFKYIPFDVLLAILMAEKDAVIQELMERQEEGRSCEARADVLYKSDGFEDSDDDRDALIRKDAEVVSLKNKISGLESELEDYRDTLTKAMHKLENMDAVMSENNLLKEKIKCSEQTIRYLEERKAQLGKELEYYRKSYGTAADLSSREKYLEKTNAWDGGDSEQVVRLSGERNILLQQVEELQKELEGARANAAEIEVLRKMSETTSSSLDEICKENECYKKKLESMKYLEKHIEELKKQAHTLTDKYKRESLKANDQLKLINVNTKELQVLRDERDRLQSRVTELMVYESQYQTLKSKLHQVDVIIDENETLNRKLIQLDRLELENEQLKMRIDQLRKAEVQAAEDKEKVMQLQCAVAEQEEEMKRMLRHIEELSRNYADMNELHRLRNELDEKNGKLKKYEKQLADIPVLESEIDLLKNKLQKCIDDFKSDKDLLRRLQEELEACRKRCHELEEMAPLCQTESSKKDENEAEPAAEESHTEPEEEEKPEFAEKGEDPMDILTQDTESQSEEPERLDQSTLKIDEALEIVEEQNLYLKSEVASLTLKLSKIDLDELLAQTNDLKIVLSAKDERIFQLDSELNSIRRELRTYETLKQNLEREVELLKERTGFMKEELDLNQDYIKEMQESLELERKGREFAKNMIKRLEEKLEEEKAKKEVGEEVWKLQKEEANVAKQEIYLHFGREVEHLKGIIYMWKKLNGELTTENELLREMKANLERTEIRALKRLIVRLRAEIKALKSLSKPELEGECEALQQQVKKLVKETDNLADEIKELKSALDSEKSVKDFLEKEVISLQAELTACITSGNEVLGREMSLKDALITDLREELAKVKSDFENSVNESQSLKDQNDKLVESANVLESEAKELKNQINLLQSREDELSKAIHELQEREKECLERTKNFEEVFASLETLQKELAAGKETVDALREKIKDMEETMRVTEESVRAMEENIKVKDESLRVKDESLRVKDESLRAKDDSLRVKEEELQLTKKESLDAANELKRLRLEIEVLKSRLGEDIGDASGESQESLNYEKDMEEKYALEEALSKIENELDGLKGKLEECKKMEDEMSNLRSKRDSLLEKMSCFESEIDGLKKKLGDFESLKNELVQLKAEKIVAGDDLEISRLYQELLEQKAQIAKLKTENDGLREDLTKTEGWLDIYKSLQKSVPENTGEFYTPPALMSPRSSGPQESSEDTISLESHKKEIKDVELLYEQKLQNLKELNTEKLKKLAEHHEKEAKFRTKSFYESINSIKWSYENDIKKLVEKHKVSIMRLQGLHEDEVQELNTTYETQMEAMQTQNENLINDLKTESAEKVKQQREQHNLDIRELSRKYEDLLREKDARILQEKANVETSLNESTNDLKEVHKQAVESLTQFYQNSIVEMEEKHGLEMKKCKKNNLKRIELMKNKYEALLAEERKKYEEQLEEMLLQLKNGQEGDHLGKNTEHYVQKKTPTSNTSLEFYEVLQKILNEGLDCLTFEELILVHSKTCFLPNSTLEGNVGGGEFSQRLGHGCKHRTLMAAEKEELLKRIFTLEHQMVIKQLETHEAIVNMEAAEICRVQELKDALATAQQKNAELKRLLSDQSKQEMNLKIDRYMSDRQANFHESNVVEKVKELEKERAERKRLGEELQKERVTVKNMAAAMEAEKERHLIQRKRDTEYVDSIRQRLEEALTHEQMMESQLDYEIKLRGRLEMELQNYHRNPDFRIDLSSSPMEIETKAAKNIKNRDQSEATKESKHGRSRSRRRSRLKSINDC